jgi:hypothetical protein
VLHALRLMLAFAVACAGSPSAAFVFSDGDTANCTAKGRPVIEIDGDASSHVAALNRVAVTERRGDGYVIEWNSARLAALPPPMHDFLFFHECAHAAVPTQDEVVANCEGLRMMRAAGRAGFAVESKLGAFYGPDNAYWARTLQCANAPPRAAAPPAQAAPPP